MVLSVGEDNSTPANEAREEKKTLIPPHSALFDTTVVKESVRWKRVIHRRLEILLSTSRRTRRVRTRAYRLSILSPGRCRKVNNSPESDNPGAHEGDKLKLHHSREAVDHEHENPLQVEEIIE